MRGSNDSIPFVSIYMSYTCMKDGACVIMVQCWFHHVDENDEFHRRSCFFIYTSKLFTVSLKKGEKMEWRNIFTLRGCSFKKSRNGFGCPRGQFAFCSITTTFKVWSSPLCMGYLRNHLVPMGLACLIHSGRRAYCGPHQPRNFI